MCCTNKVVLVISFEVSVGVKCDQFEGTHTENRARLISKLTNADAAARKASGSWHGERSLKRRAIMRPIILKCESRKAAQSKNTEVQM